MMCVITKLLGILFLFPFYLLQFSYFNSSSGNKQYLNQVIGMHFLFPFYLLQFSYFNSSFENKQYFCNIWNYLSILPISYLSGSSIFSLSILSLGILCFPISILFSGNSEYE